MRECLPPSFDLAMVTYEPTTVVHGSRVGLLALGRWPRAVGAAARQAPRRSAMVASASIDTFKKVSDRPCVGRGR
jgi:hypothetical protein